MIGKGLSVSSWPSGHAQDSEEAIAFARLHNINCMVEKFPLAKANEAFEHMLNGKARFRAVITMEMKTTSEKIIVPAHIPKPLPTPLRAELQAALLSNKSMLAVQSALSDTSRDAGWVDDVRRRAKQMIGSGEATTPRDVMDKLIKEAQGETAGRENLRGGLRRAQRDEGVGAGGRPAEPTISIIFPEAAATKGKEVIRDALEGLVDVENTTARS
ncbi:MAG: hypothetical protein Q9174_005184 [Haloplaca sp. 1 TL-2023]